MARCCTRVLCCNFVFQFATTNICLLYLLATDISISPIRTSCASELNIAAHYSQAIASRNPWFLLPPLIEAYWPSSGGEAMRDTF